LQAISKNSSHKLLDNGHPCTDGLMQRTLERSVCGVINSSLKRLLMSNIFKTTHNNILSHCKTKTQIYFCELHIIISIIIPIRVK